MSCTEISKALGEAGELRAGRRWEKFLSQLDDVPRAARQRGRGGLDLDFTYNKIQEKRG